jgi:hypothetical protein
VEEKVGGSAVVICCADKELTANLSIISGTYYIFTYHVKELAALIGRQSAGLELIGKIFVSWIKIV